MRLLIISFFIAFISLFPLGAKESLTNPVISPYGKITPLPKAEFQPDKSISVHKIIFELTKPSSSPENVNPSLERVARTINLYASAGIAPSRLQIVAVISGSATPLALDNDQYKKQFGTDNPNLALIDILKNLGVQISVCGQAWNEHNFKEEWLYKNVSTALSALTTIVLFQQKGYALIPL